MNFVNRILIMVLLTVLTASCANRDTEAVSAAKEMYSYYADHSEKLTVAFIGDFEAGGTSYNAVMFQTDDSLEWEWLMKEFDVSDEIGFREPENNSMLKSTIMIDSSVVFESEAELNRYVDSVVRAMMKDLTGSDSYDSTLVVRADASSNLLKEQPRTSNEGGVNDLEPGSIPLMIVDSNRMNDNRIYKLTRKYHNSGYVVGCDYENHTLWLLFYDSDSERNIIIRKVMEKMYGKEAV